MWCPEKDCPASIQPTPFSHGDRLGSVKILDLLRTLPHASVYRAEHRGTACFVKVAHPQEACETYLKREATLLKRIHESKYRHPALPGWLDHESSEQAFARVQVGGQMWHYVLFDHHDGVLLADLLLETPQWWYKHAAWFALSLAEAVSIVEALGCVHANLHPDNLLTYENNLGVPQPYLLDLGLTYPAESKEQQTEISGWQQYLLPSYSPRQIVQTQKGTRSADVQAIGTLLYELLEGKPAYPQLLRSIDQVYEDIRTDAPPLHRPDLDTVQGKNGLTLTKVVETTLRDAPAYADAATLAKAIRSVVGPVEDKRDFQVDRFLRRASVGVVAVALFMMIAFTLVMLLLALLGPEITVA